MSKAADQAMEALLFLDLTAEDWLEISERTRFIADDRQVGEYMEVSALIGDIEPWDGISNPGEVSVHYDTWLAKGEMEVDAAFYSDSADPYDGDRRSGDPQSYHE